MPKEKKEMKETANLTKDEKDLIKISEDYANSQGFKLNDNKQIVLGIIRGLLRNKKFKGDIYCPCRIVTDNKEEDKKIICPCIYHKDEIKKDGHCKCTLFWKK
jgi:ferredoxin-thioredoxin reductase catalytic subunit